MSTGRISFDALAADIVERSGYRFTEARTNAEMDVAFRLRYEAIIDQGWTLEANVLEGRERDVYDDRSVHIVGWDDDVAMATGRIVLPPGRMPSEDLCGIHIEPYGQVVEVGRMTVARSHQNIGHGVFVALLARLYLEVRGRGYEVACGMMSQRSRSLTRLLGLQLEILGEDRPYWGEPRAPVRFDVTINDAPLTARWQSDTA